MCFIIFTIMFQMIQLIFPKKKKKFHHTSNIHKLWMVTVISRVKNVANKRGVAGTIFTCYQHINCRCIELMNNSSNCRKRRNYPHFVSVSAWIIIKSRFGISRKLHRGDGFQEPYCKGNWFTIPSTKLKIIVNFQTKLTVIMNGWDVSRD